MKKLRRKRLGDAIIGFLKERCSTRCGQIGAWQENKCNNLKTAVVAGR